MTTWLVAHDLTSLGHAAAAEAAALAHPTGGRLYLLHVYPETIRAPYDRDGNATFNREEEQRNVMRGAAEQLKATHPGLHIDIEVLEGDPKTRILEEADRLNAHMVVVGTHDRKGLSRLMLGSVAEAIVHLAKVPVLVVKNAR
jgi:nucleotide-binding universal stress UspA family protein